MISASMVLGASQCHGIALPLHPDLQQKLTMQASGYTHQHKLWGADEVSESVVIDKLLSYNLMLL
jgi:hypothetical protein